MIKILSISDDSRLTDCITEFCLKFPDSRLVGEGLDLGSSTNHLTSYAPSIVIVDLDFLNIEFLEKDILGNRLFKGAYLVGLTSNYKKAYYSLKKGFVDVSIKPFVREELFNALINCRNEIFKRDRILTISSPKDAYYLRVCDILYLKADNNNVDIHLKDGTVLPVFNSLKHFQSRLTVPFVRIQKSYIINVTQVCRINRIKRFIMLRKRNERIPFSEKYLENMEGLESLIRNW